MLQRGGMLPAGAVVTSKIVHRTAPKSNRIDSLLWNIAEVRSRRPWFAITSSTMRGLSIETPWKVTASAPSAECCGTLMRGVLDCTHQLSFRFGLADRNVAQVPSEPTSRATTAETTIAQTFTFSHHSPAMLLMRRKYSTSRPLSALSTHLQQAKLGHVEVLVGQVLVPVLSGVREDAREWRVWGWRFGGQFEAGDLESEAETGVVGVIVDHRTIAPSHHRSEGEPLPGLILRGASHAVTCAFPFCALYVSGSPAMVAGRMLSPRKGNQRYRNTYGAVPLCAPT